MKLKKKSLGIGERKQGPEFVLRIVTGSQRVFGTSLEFLLSPDNG